MGLIYNFAGAKTRSNICVLRKTESIQHTLSKEFTNSVKCDSKNVILYFAQLILDFEVL